jgi:hypothetical protein
VVAFPRAFLLACVACAAVVAVLAVVWYYPAPSNAVTVPKPNPPPDGSTVVVVDVDFIADYYTNNSSATGYWEDTYCLNSSTYQKEQGNQCSSGTITTPDCPEDDDACANVTPGAEFQYDLGLFDNGTGYHTIVAIGVESPFSVVSVTPSLPLKMKPGVPGVTFRLTISTPSSPGDYGLEGYVASY